jgi:hypothetical protein
VEEEKGIHLTDRAYLVVVRLSSAQDVSTIDLNCGCPKRFSVHGGMGAALMDEPEKLCGVRSCIDSMLEQHFFFAFFFFLNDSTHRPDLESPTWCQRPFSFSFLIYVDPPQFG